MSDSHAKPEAVPLCALRAADLRLRSHADFQRVYGATKKQHAKQMSFFAAGRPAVPGGYNGPRVGLTVGKVMGKAHVRNRIKRRLREAVRAEQAALGGMPVDVVLHPRRTVETLPMPELRVEIAAVFRRAVRLAIAPVLGASGLGSSGQGRAQIQAPSSVPESVG